MGLGLKVLDYDYDFMREVPFNMYAYGGLYGYPVSTVIMDTFLGTKFRVCNVHLL